ncbi:hypothetical protein OAH58_01505, partial [bacterium]|nr:hypothetical protein [bacterium]
SLKNQAFQGISLSCQNTFDRGVVFASFPLAFGIGARIAELILSAHVHPQTAAGNFTNQLVKLL